VAVGRRRVRARVEGVVQGVGFRPHAFRLARELGLAGWVLNDERGVVVEVEGDGAAVRRFLARLTADAPPLAAVERLETEERAPTGAPGFRIVQSSRAGDPAALVSADTATCDDCLKELFDPGDRRHRHPFISCTNCGPRFTIVRDVPYDRPRTTMAGFEMCDDCRREYENPADRRFHAQPIACHACGPTVRLADRSGASLADRGDALRAAAAALRGGRIVAVKGLGGFHLACRADDEAAVAALRTRKHREEKPFALMAAGLGAVRALVELGPAEEALLLGRERPIVLAPRRAGAPIAAAVAPASRELGVMLPYSPLHHLLLADAAMTLVMTSGNVSDEPIAYRDDDALARLADIADLFLLHDRPIHMRTDDSVVRAVHGRPVMLRRSRGHVPRSLDLPLSTPQPLLATGAELKSTFCLARDRRAWMGHHIGDLATWETLRSFREGIVHFERLFAVVPEVVAHDLHPDYLSTGYALERQELCPVGVQHHHAHLAACLAEHGEEGPAVGAIYDGTGYGTDGTVWGGELLVGDLCDSERAGHLLAVPMPGGEQAIRQPWRMARAWLLAAGVASPALAARVGPERWDAVGELARRGVASPATSSMGRLFDAVAALCGGPLRVTYEGQAAVELEALAAPATPTAAGARPAPAARAARGAYPLPFGAGLVLDARETVRAVVVDLGAGVAPAVVAARFHAAIADATAGACARVAAERGLGTVVLSGGVFQNRLLLVRTGVALEEAGLRVLIPRRLPPNDGGIAFGQAAVAAARLRRAGG
jgi:hydrogenase maturation protein HypF